uniref:Ovule protein n=1 Tax=Haemonchus placei TaxID=6290 RepID=A0A0N4WX69_HAEPC
LEITAQPPLRTAKQHRHSVHTSNMQQLQISSQNCLLQDPSPSNGPQRSTSSDYCREERRDTLVKSNKFLKWLGIGNAGTDKKDMKNRRMSTFT